MAEFALGLTKTAVAGTVSRVKLAIEEETKLRVRVQDDLVFITGELEMIQSFLNVANAERTNNQVVRTWVRQLRDLAFDVEDSVEFIVHLDKASPLDWVRRLAYSLMCMGMAGPPLPLDVAVADVKRLKARVQDVSQRNTRYNLIGDSGSSLRQHHHHDSSSSSSSSNSSAPSHLMLAATAGKSSSALYILREVWEATGKLRSGKGLRHLITGESENLEVISVWASSPGASAHLGVTHVMKEVYNHREICQEFKIRAWVKPTHPFNTQELLSSLLAQFYATSRQTNALDFRKMKDDDEIIQKLSQQRYLVVVEELSTLVEWDAIRMYLSSGKTRSRIVVVTQQLGLALSCTGEPYQVSELRQSSDGESLFAFFNKVPWRRSDLGDFIWQLRRRGTISVWGLDDGESSLVDEVYTCLIHKSDEFDGVKFQRHNWVNVSDPFDLNVFCWRLFLNFHSVGLRVEKIAEVGMMGYSGIIQECCRFLREDDCLVVINGLKSIDDWKLIKDTLLSEPTKGSIIIITEKESLAMYCADEKDRALSVDDLKADAVLRHWIKNFQFYRTGGKEEGRFFSTRMNRAREWTDMFGDAVSCCSIHYSLRTCLQFPGVVSLWGPAGAGKSGLVKRLYYSELLAGGYRNFAKLSWVNVVHPFNLTDFCWELLLDFHSDSPEAKHNTSLGIIKGQDQVAECLKFLCEHKCLVVINGLHDWDCINDVFLSGSTNSCIVVITTEAIVAMHCGVKKDRVFNVKGAEAGKRLPPFAKAYRDDSDEEDGSLRGLVFSNRMEKARDWMGKLDHDVHFMEWKELTQLLKSGSYGVISVWGIAGVGISTLIKSIYYNRMLGLKHQRTSPGQHYFEFFSEDDFTMFSWVHAPHPFNLKEFSWCLLLDFLSDDPEAKENATLCMMDGHDPIERCRSFLHQHKCFIVIDALQSTQDWDLIKVAFLSKPINGCIVVNTYEATVAAHCALAKESVFNVKGLEPDVALQLFQKIAWGGKKLCREEEEVSKLTMAKCGGLPKVITAIGQYFGNGRFTISRSELERLNSDFMGNLEKDPGFDNLRGLFSWIRSYFDACSDSLKPCIFYLSVFPATHKSIRPSRLVRRWIAEGYARDKVGSTAEEDGEALLSELIKLSIIQQHQQSPNNYSKVGMCQANGFFREYIVSRPMQDNLVFALEGRCSPNSQRMGRHLTISSSWDRDKIVYESIDFTRIRSLTVFGKWMSFFVSDKMRFLRVLDLEDTLGVTNDDLEQIIKLLRRLKFLSLRGCKEITSLPDSLGEMKQLQTLDVKHTSIVTLPVNITKLQRLHYINAGRTTMPSNGETKDTTIVAAIPPEDDVGSWVPSPPTTATTPPPDHDNGALGRRRRRTRAHDLVSTWLSNVNKLGKRQFEIKNGGVEFVPAAVEGVGKLTALHTLGVINVRGSGANLIFREVKKLTQLRKLRLSGINRKNWQDMWCAISGHGYLASLLVHLDCNKKRQQDLYCLDDISEPPTTLKSFKMYGGKIQVSLAWIKKLDNLKKAHLEDLELTVSTQEHIESLMELPCKTMLRRIRIKPIQNGQLRYGLLATSIGEQFTAAKILQIECGNYRCDIEFLTGWKFVEVLVVHCSTTEASLEISSLHCLSGLKEVRLKGSYSEAVKQHLQQELDDEFSPSTRPELKLDPQ